MEKQNNKDLLLTIKRTGINGEGIAYYKRKAVFIPNAIVGEVVEARITKNLDNYAYGEITSIKTRSEHRINPRCEYFGKCGGCQLQHMDYQFQLEQKREMVAEAFEKYFDGNKTKIKVLDCIGMEDPWFYRNKTQLPARHDGEKVVVGMYAMDSNMLVYIDKCLIENKLISTVMDDILKELTKANIDVYNPRFKQGNLRYIVIRGFEETQEVQVTFVLMKSELKLIKKLKEIINVNHVKSVNVTVNDDPKSIEIISNKVSCIEGKEKIKGKLKDLEFEILPNAFFQLNSTQTIKLYDEIIKCLKPTGNELVLDLYCGIGSIGLYISKFVKELRGIDINIDGINDAREFARNNGIQNAKFYCGNILKNLIEFESHGFVPDCVIVDPPRRGIELSLLNYFKKSNIKKIIYVSCNPSTLVKNLNHLQNDYTIKYIRPLDLFPQTSHIECVCELNLKEKHK